ncbi:MAG: cation:proton antiporter [Gammaproteobacteria bacterium]|nr:cation:proton antiporter [Gammaproteobacteria bacterium]NIR84505.1 cation:proton antiporter [Gammaproteobacteria bacterium]NIR90408.1 cation:proton antiporter [Gammaproteobacteria bacterium]NIU05556.1 cation:proton antiporter [Gammaproteobacteria bacterium]NIV52695.1 cation:proton antiporter [Gammaproteobacteria bacterium]
MEAELNIFAVCVLFAGAALLAALALYARQSLLVAYIVLGGLLGPSGLGLVSNTATIREIGHVGIIFLLFLLGLNLHPQKLLHGLRAATLVTLISSLVFALVGFGIGRAFGFSMAESVLIGVMMPFSSTIISLKLLPTTALHHRHTGEIIIAVLLLQDVLAIAILLLLQGLGTEGLVWRALAPLMIALPAITAAAFVVERYVLVPLMARFDSIQEYIFLTAIGWCLGVAQLAESAGLSYEIGAFIAGVALATNRISLFISEHLKPLRDFFLIMFFFSLGAGFEPGVLPEVAVPAGVLAAAMLIIKPPVFRMLLVRSGEAVPLAWEVGIRLGQSSEFSLLIAVLAVQAGVLGQSASYVVQAATLLTFIVSSYVVMLQFPTPIAVSDRLRRD